LYKPERHCRRALEQAQARLTALQNRRAALAAENAAQPNLPRCCLRMDAGFSSGANLTALLELGYDIETKAANGKVVAALQQRLTPATVWTSVGKNAEMVGWTNYQLSSCPYPLTVGLERFHTPQGVQYAVLARSQEDPAASCPDLRAWFAAYNGRGTVEAGIKQSKTVFHVQYLMSRQVSGMQIQVALTLFAANFVGWARAWLRERVETGVRAGKAGIERVKQVVRVGANSPAVVEQVGEQWRVRFSASSSWAGVSIWLAPQPVIQLELPWPGAHLVEQEVCCLRL
jgi:hypothetical protein